MELTRRQFIIKVSTAAAVMTLPATYVSANKEIRQQLSNFKNFTSRQIEELDKYVIASVIPSIVTMLFLAYTLEMFSLISSLIIILLSLILLF
tara:strand:- start:707 stop:985 length:279 start_codon:yes stop_codon:yes gene_type:complete